MTDLTNMPAVDLDSIEPNSTVMIRGTISYSHVATKVAGEELDRYNARRKFPTGEHTSITLSDVEVIAVDPNNLSLAEIYLTQHLYRSNNQERYPGWSYTALNKGQYLPAVGALQADGSYRQVWPTAELANGQKAIVLLRVFPTRMVHQGITFDAVLVQSAEVAYRNAGGMRLGNDLAKYGIVWQPTANPADGDDSVPTPEQAAGTLPLASVAAAAPAPVSVAQPAAVPVAQPIVGAAQPAAVPVAAPVVGGIMYDANDR